MKRKTLINLIKLLFLFSLITYTTIGIIGAFSTGASPAGGDIFSTNTIITFTNQNGITYTNTGFNTNLVVQAIYGFTNYGTINYGSTNAIEPSGQRTYTYTFTNFANTNTLYHFDTATTYFNKGAGSDWTITIRDSGDDSITTNKNIAQDTFYSLYIQVDAAGDSVDGCIAEIQFDAVLSNAESNRSVVYTGSNGYTYGGYPFFSDTISLIIGVPSIVANKSVAITNWAGGSIGGTEVIPGAIVTYTLDYTNNGGANAYNVEFVEYIPTNYTSFVSNSITGNYDSIVYSTNGYFDATYAPSGSNDTLIDAVKFTVNTISNIAGSFSYQVIVR